MQEKSKKRWGEVGWPAEPGEQKRISRNEVRKSNGTSKQTGDALLKERKAQRQVLDRNRLLIFRIPIPINAQTP